jgi:hypothetical protein
MTDSAGAQDAMDQHTRAWPGLRESHLGESPIVCICGPSSPTYSKTHEKRDEICKTNGAKRSYNANLAHRAIAQRRRRARETMTPMPCTTQAVRAVVVCRAPVADRQ